MFSRVTTTALLFQKNAHHRIHTRLLASAAAQTQSSQQWEAKPYESIPGLSSLPLIGPLHHFLPLIGKIGPPENFAAMLETFHKQFGPVVKMDGVFRRAGMVILYEPEHYDQVYRAEEVTPLRPGFESLVYYRTDLRKDIYKGIYGLTTAQGSQWREFRTKVNPALLKPKLVKVYAPGLEDISREMVKRLTALSSEYLQNNFEVEMTKFSLESVGLVGLGARIGCLENDVTDNQPARKLMQSAKDMIEIGFKLELNPIQLWRHISTPAFKKLVNAMDTQWEISAKFIQEARQIINRRRHDVPEEEKSIIEKLLAIDEKVAVMMANEMLMAGIDTVAFATTAIMYHLALNQKVQDKLRLECRSGETNRRYLKACLKEALRLNPVISANLRRTTKDHFVGGYHIPKGVDVIAPNEYLSKIEKYYPQPKEFIPERWLVDKMNPLYYGNAHPMVTLPFGFGVRMCIGRRIAELEIETFLNCLVKDYAIKWDGPPLKITTRVMNKFEKPYHFKFEAFKNQSRQLVSAAAQSPPAAQEKVKPFESIPGLSSLPLIGTLHHFLPAIGKIGPTVTFANLLEILHKEYGPVVRTGGTLGKVDMVVLYKPEHYVQVYRAEEITPLRPGFDPVAHYRTNISKDKYKGFYGLTAAQGTKWREFRTKVNPTLLKPKLVKFHTAGIEEIAKDMVARLTALSSEYLRNNFEVEMNKFSLESVGLVGLDARIGCLQDDITEDARKLMQSAKDILDIGLKLEINPIKLWRYFSTPAIKKLTTAMDTQWDITSKFIRQARQRINERGHDIPEEQKSIVEKLLAIDEKVAIVLAEELLMAGIDTVTFTVTALMYSLAMNKKVQNKLREECHSEEHKTRYLKACFKEALRLNPVVPLNLRRTTKDHVVAGYHIPKGVDIIAPHEYLSQSSKYYLKHTEFIPERWLVDKKDPLYYGNAHPMVTLPFGFGVRMCIGKRIAELEIESLIHTLIKDYVIKWDGPPLKVVTNITKKFEKPYHFKFKAIK